MNKNISADLVLKLRFSGIQICNLCQRRNAREVEIFRKIVPFRRLLTVFLFWEILTTKNFEARPVRWVQSRHRDDLHRK